MKRIYEFIKLYSYTSKKKYLYLSLELLVFCFTFHLVLNNLGEIQQIKQTLESVTAKNLYLADIVPENVDDIASYLAQLQKKLPQEIKTITLSKKSAFTDQIYNNKQISVNFLSSNEVQQFKYLISKGDYFRDSNYGDNIYPAIISEKLSGEYKIGEVYEISIKKNLKNLESIKIKIVGVRKDNYILELGYSSANVSKRNTTILLFDQKGNISENFYNDSSSSISILLKAETDQSEESLISSLQNYGLKNVKNLERSILEQKGLTYKDRYIYFTLLIVMIPLIVVSMVSSLYLEFQNRKRELYILHRCGIDPNFYLLSVFFINFSFFVFPVIIQEIVWFLICLTKDIRFIGLHSLLIVITSLFTTFLVTFCNAYSFSKIGHKDKTLDKEITCE